MNIDSSSSANLAVPLQQRNESRTNEADAQARQSQGTQQSSSTPSNDNQVQQRNDSASSEIAREDRSSEFALNQNRSISSLATQSAGESRGQNQTQQQEPSQEQVAARRREQIEQEISNIRNPNQGQSRLNIEV